MEKIREYLLNWQRGIETLKDLFKALYYARSAMYKADTVDYVK
jgi:hypothetical protein